MIIKKCDWLSNTAEDDIKYIVYKNTNVWFGGVILVVQMAELFQHFTVTFEETDYI